MTGTLSGKRILIGVSGGIAIYKTLSLLSMLNKAGAHTEVVMTKHARDFVSEMTFATMSKHPVHTDLLAVGDHDIPHIDLTKRHDLFLIAPATANVIAKMRMGLADDLLSATALASSCPIIIAPAMNTNMYCNPATQENLKVLASRGVQILAPTSGLLACDVVGDGRMEEPEDLFHHLEAALSKKDLKGKKIVVTAGPTKERIDPVRFLTNDSSGKMGVAIADRAHMRGADVLLIHGDLKVEIPEGIATQRVESTADLAQAVQSHFADADCLVMAAAPSDFKPEHPLSQKWKKKLETDAQLANESPSQSQLGKDASSHSNEDQGHADASDVVTLQPDASHPKQYTLQLTETVDILQSVAEKKQKQTVIGFAAETENVIENARAKLLRKGLDYIVANDVSKPGAGFDVDTNIATILSADKEIALEKMSKRELADRILDLIV